MILRGSVYSESLHMHTGINVLVPEKLTGDRYKIAYLLHGLHGNQDTWLENTLLPVYAQTYNTIFVMPEVGRSFYADMKYGHNYFTYISEELPEICGKVFAISAKREDTAIMGCSMGGYGALKAALTKPERFSFCGAISPACLFMGGPLTELRTNSAQWLKIGGPEAGEILRDFYAIFGDDLIFSPDDEILELAQKSNTAPVKPKIYAACGTEDNLYKENLRFKEEIEKLNFDYTFESWKGIHDWYFFDEGLKKTLKAWLA
ncbi:tributyrin esterase [Spirochaetia bacterium]|nr:tributyrin esterase [Spirochaetia bacterium]